MVYSQWLSRQPAAERRELDPDAIQASFRFAAADEAELHRLLRQESNRWFADIIVAEFEQDAPLE